MAAPGNQQSGVSGGGRWDRVKTIFTAALSVPAAERQLFLAGECGADLELRREVESLLESHEGAADFIEEPPAEVKAVLAPDTATISQEATRIGAYQLVREIGRGGMGTVYLAVRADEEFEKRVAIKLIRPGMETEFVVRRFRNERQILARLEHANIARLIDGGTTPGGLPYFVMEYVEGSPITAFCRERELSETEKLELFLKVCAPIQYAHERNIIHRDIKPTNILIKKDGSPRLLDFGIAKVLNADTDRRLETTLMGVRMMTPAYASPEQLRGEDPTVVSDVYSLGVVLYEVLHGRRPGDTEPRTGALPAIVRKAIQADPGRRHQSVEALAADIRGHLAGETPAAPMAMLGATLAVLPFHVLQTDTGTDEYLGVAMADSLITKLSNVRRVSVRSTRAVLKWAGEADSVAAGNELCVDWVLDGQIRKAGGRLRLTVQLVEVSKKTAVWAAVFDEKLDDLLMLEDRLSGQVAAALIPQLSGDERRDLSRKQTASAQAHQAYLRGRWHWNFQTEEHLAQALVSFSEAISEDPQFAQAHAGVADYYLWSGIWGAMPAAESFAAAKKAAQTAVGIDPEAAEAHASLGFAWWACDRDGAVAEKEFKEAIRLNPNLGRAHQWLGLLHSSKGEHEQAVACLERARSTDQECPTFTAAHGLALYHARRYREGLDELAALRAQDGESAHLEEVRAWCWLGLGNVPEAANAARRAAEISERSGSSLAALGVTLQEAGDEAGARETLAELCRKAAARYVSGYHIALLQMSVGKRKAALGCLEAAVKSGDWWVLWSGVQPRFDSLHGNKRFTRVAGGAAEAPAALPTRRRWMAAALAVPAVAALGGAAAVLLRARREPFQQVRITKLTTNGLATHAAISPDGRYLAYSAVERGLQALWLRQINSSTTVRITAPMDADLSRLSFSPDGTYLGFMALRLNDTGHGVLYQVPSLGGPMQKIAGDLAGPASISPDGRRVAAIRGNPEKRRDELYVAGLDGGSERVVAVRNYPDRISSISTPVWSSDGNLILCAVQGSDGEGFYIYPMAVRADGGPPRTIRAKRWQYLEQAGWTADGAGLLVIGREHDSSFKHIWYLPYPSGEARQINNDFANYSGITVTDDLRRIVSVQSMTAANIWVARRADGGDPAQVTQGSGRYFDIKWAGRNRLAYASDASGSAEIWMIDADGSGQRQITSGSGRSYAPAPTPAGDAVLYHSNRSGNWNIWRTSLEGGTAQQLTVGPEDSNWPGVTPDGKWAVYHHTADGTWNLWKVPVEGGAPVRLTRSLTMYPAVSPRDGRIAAWYSSDAAKPRWQIAVFGAEGGEPVRAFDVPPSASAESPLRWTQDGKAIGYIDSRNGASNIYMQPVDGGESRALTAFTSGQIYAFDWAPDGRLAFARGQSSTDVVLLTDIGK